jgi:uncharacterized glyoxalase superfamily protein PhnB
MTTLVLGIIAIAAIMVVAGIAVAAFAFYRNMFGAHRPGALADRALRQLEESAEATLEMQEEIQRKAVLRRVRCEYCDSTVDMGENCPNCGASLPE